MDNTMGYKKPCSRHKPPLTHSRVKVHPNNHHHLFHLHLMLFFLSFYAWGSEIDVAGGGPKDFPPSHGCSCSVENSLF